MFIGTTSEDIILSLCQLFLDISNTCFTLVSKSHWQPVPGGLLLAPHDTEQHQLFVVIRENEALENEDRSTKHPKLENEAPKTRKRSTQVRK